MSKKLAFERYVWFLDQAGRGRYPNTRKLAEHHTFEISIPQAQRDIEFMRERLNAPLEYDPVERGYTLNDDSYHLPITWIKNEELLLFTIAKELLKDKDSKNILNVFQKKISSFSDTDLEQIEKFISYKGMRLYRLKAGILNSIISAMLQSMEIEILYSNIYKTDEDAYTQVLSPVHLVFFSGNWYLIGKTGAKTKTYTLARIQHVKLTGNKAKNVPDDNIKKRIDDSFGIFIPGPDEKTSIIKLKFNKEMAPYIQTMILHGEQEENLLPDGSLIITFPSILSSELISEILKFRDNVVVLEPEELRVKMKECLKNMVDNYIS